MLEQATDVFDNRDGKFLARLREYHQTQELRQIGKPQSHLTARIEANYSPDIIRKIEAGRLIAIPNVMGVNSKDNYSIYEVAALNSLNVRNSQNACMYLQAISLIEKYRVNKVDDKRQRQQQGRYPFERFASVTSNTGFDFLKKDPSWIIYIRYKRSV